jgi:O-antigen/teichoic acid export membrane protein
MPTEIGALARHTGVYGLGTIVGGIARAVLVPIVARYVPAEEYGKASVVMMLVVLLSIISELGLSSSLIKFVNEATTEDERKRVVSTVLVGSLLVAVPLALICGLLLGSLSQLLLGSADYRALVLVGVLGGFGSAILQVGLSFERALARSTRYLFYTLAKGVLSLVLSIALVVLLRQGARGLLVGAALPPLVIGAVVYGRLFARCGLRFSTPDLRAMFKFGGPLMPMNLAMWVLTYSDIYLLRRLSAAQQALSEVGLYQYAQEICLVLVLPITALNLAWPQFLFSNYRKPEGRALFARVHVYFSFFLIAIGFLVSVFARQIVAVVGSSRYEGSAQVMPLLAGSLVFYGLAVIFSSGLYVSGKTSVLASVAGASAVLNVALNFVLIPWLGKQGAALATMITNLVMMITILVSAQARFRIPFAWGRCLASVLLGAVILAGLEALEPRDLAMGMLPLRLIAACGFSLALLALLGLRINDLRRGLGLLRSVLMPGGPAGPAQPAGPA